MRPNFKFLLALALMWSAVNLHAAELKIEARLLWGANDGKETIKFEPVDPGLSDKLHRTFKWKNYFEITNKVAAIPDAQTVDMKMSDACTVRVKNLGGSRVEISCIGKGKLAHKGSYTLAPSQWLVLGGNDSANTAWFVGLRATDKTAVAVPQPHGTN